MGSRTNPDQNSSVDKLKWKKHSSQVPSLSCPLSFVVALSHLQVRHKRPGWICSWISEQLISKSIQENFVGVAQKDYYYLSCNFTLQLAKNKQTNKCMGRAAQPLLPSSGQQR